MHLVRKCNRLLLDQLNNMGMNLPQNQLVQNSRPRARDYSINPRRVEFPVNEPQVQRGGKDPGYIYVALVVLAVLLVIFAVVAYSYYGKYQQAQVAAGIATDNSIPVKDRLAVLVELPQGEDPSVATVTDVSKIKDQIFFRNAQNGDNIVAYPNAKIAILFRPSTGKVVWMGPILEGQGGVPAATPNTTQLP